ncbi:MAG TPA: hypothetical protein VJC08_03700 [bacterium]|nr:hypothetical protein [bacterium]
MPFNKLLASLFLLLFIFSQNILACDSCGCSLARFGSERVASEAEKPLFFDFTVEQQVWHQRDVALAHQLHHEGHDSHDKLREEFYHFSLGANPFERVSLLATIPYVARHVLEVDNHRHLGERQRSEGFGDLALTGIFKLLKKERDFIGPVVGLKMPTGKTTAKNSQGAKFEAELQPGSGSWDPIMGAAFQYQLSRLVFHGNALYAIRTNGAHEFRAGNLFSTYLYADYLLNPKSKYFQNKVGMVTILQNEQKQKNHRVKVADSGGTTILMGPEISIRGNSFVSVFGNILFPVYQNLGGIHQLLQFVWNAGVKISF